jgi:hypothetical protein
VNIVIRTLATGAEREITGPVDFGNGVFIDVDEMEPSWSPTGDRIAFTSVRPEMMVNPITGELEVAAQYEIVTVNIDGSDERIVSGGTPGSDRATYLEEDRSPSWSPDGRMVLFMSQAQVPACCGPWQVWAVNRDGSAATNLTSDETVNDLYPSWSPDGTLVLFTRADAGGFNLYTMPAPTPLPLATAGATPGRDRAGRTVGRRGNRSGEAADVRRQCPGRRVGLRASAKPLDVGADGDDPGEPGGPRSRVQPSARHPVRLRLFGIVRRWHTRAAARGRKTWQPVRRVVWSVSGPASGVCGEDGRGPDHHSSVPTKVDRGAPRYLPLRGRDEASRTERCRSGASLGARDARHT